MDRDSFLDTNVIINFTNYEKNKSEEITTKCYLYITNKKGRFIICYAVLRELSKIIAKLSVIHKEVLKKIGNKEYHFKESKILSKRDIPYAEKLFLAYKEINRDNVSEIFASQRDIFEIEIDKFLKNKIDVRVIPMEQINIDIVNSLKDIIENYADCQILASALQYQKEENIFLFVTADKKDLNPNNYDFLKDHGILKDYKFPELHNLCFTG